MKKLFLPLFIVILLLAACGSNKKDDKTITVGASPAPHAEILEEAKPILEKEGYKLNIKIINDYTTPNRLLNEGELDANFFQHEPYLKNEVKTKKYDIVSVGNVHIEPMAVYSKKYKSLKDLPNDAKVFVSNSVSDEGRFLSFFNEEGLITLKKGVNPVDATFSDIDQNKKAIQFNNKQAPEFLAKTFKNNEGDAVIINSNFAIDNGLNPLKDSIALEKTDSPYANLVAVKKENKENDKTKALIKALQSKEIQNFINEKYDGKVIPAK